MGRAPLRLVVLGSTGSIGTQTLDVVHRLREAGYPVTIIGLGAGSNLPRLRCQIERDRPRIVSVRSEADAAVLVRDYPELEVVHGETGLSDLAGLDDVDMVVNALVGAVGLPPTLAALARGRTVALANKESLVVGGALVQAVLDRANGRILPIDSEHNALFQCLEAGRRDEVARVILTASGGPFLRLPPADLETVTPETALRHPNWAMGPRITIDSATMVNKAFEVIEAHHLFGLPYDRIAVVVHPGSTVHSLVEYRDGSVLAELAPSDMRIPIQYALTYPERVATGLSRLDLSRPVRLELEPLDPDRFPAFSTVLEAASRGGAAPAVANAADEVLVERFLAGEIPFPAIARGLATVLRRWEEPISPEPPTLRALTAADRWAREAADAFCRRSRRGV